MTQKKLIARPPLEIQHTFIFISPINSRKYFSLIWSVLEKLLKKKKKTRDTGIQSKYFENYFHEVVCFKKVFFEL